ncbi:MAG: Kelch-like protein 1, partial [Myxococcales bacterium]|nr:Kelch-like protein 1 [Myxococcales bacterium]
TCVGGVCCAGSCAGPCQSACQANTGACLHKTARTACGVKTGPSGPGAGSDVQLSCDGNGNCIAPSISCQTTSGLATCDLNMSACCLAPVAGGTAFACTAASQCLTTSAGDFFQGYSCSRTADCPTGTSCCWQQVTPDGGHWATCSASCANGTLVDAGTVAAGHACTSNDSCVSGTCLGGVCCAGSCAGPCQSACQANTGACLHKTARTACGVKAGPSGPGAGSDVQLTCDGNGNCVAPSITCAGITGNGPCDLNRSACCTIPSGVAGGGSVFECGLASQCLASSAGDLFQGYSCARAADCPTGTSCCLQATPGGGRWATCAASCAGGTAVDIGSVAAGQPCTSDDSCVSGTCVGGVCCAGACAGPCDACQASTGACVHKTARTACGVKAGPSGPGAGSDVQLACDGNGSCVAPSISCAGNSGTVPCDLSRFACCTTSSGIAGGSVFACGLASQCLASSAGDLFQGYSCSHAADCPTGTQCCWQTTPDLGHWATCAASCSSGVVLP